MKLLNTYYLNEKEYNFTIKLINDNEISFINKFGIEMFEFIKEYPFIIDYPKYKHIPDEYCKCCGYIIPNDKKIQTIDDGYIPNIDDITISSYKLADVIRLKNSTTTDNTFKDFKAECELFLLKFKQIRNKQNYEKNIL